MNFEALNAFNHLIVSSLSALKEIHNNASNYNDTVVLNNYRGTYSNIMTSSLSLHYTVSSALVAFSQCRMGTKNRPVGIL